MNMNKPQNAL
jgi:vacuolar protein sorting-associated protein 13A/C